MGNCKVGGVHDQSLTKLETPSFGDELDDHFIEGCCTSLLIRSALTIRYHRLEAFEI